MTSNSAAFLRHRIIDTCLRDTKHKYTLDDLIAACSKALQERQGKKPSGKPAVSLRTLQLDLQFMRDAKKGYNAPIIVYEHKYYKYKDSNYSIEKAKLRKESLEDLSEIVETLHHYSTFRELKNLQNVINILWEEIESKVEKRNPVISYEGKKNPLGLEYFETVHDAITHRKVLCIDYYSSRSNNILPVIFYPFYLKEYKGRWFALGYKDGMKGVYKLPLDRIRDFSYSILPFPEELNFHPDTYFRDIIGVTRLSGEVREIRFLVKNKLALYILANPLHESQQMVEKQDTGDYVFTIHIIPNKEFYNLITEYQPYIRIIAPREIGLQANAAFVELAEQLPDYSEPIRKNEQISEQDYWENTLFSEL